MALGDGSAYPTTIDNFVDPSNKIDIYDARYISDLKDAITKIETELATDVAGTAADLKTRLAVSLDDSGALAEGTSNPVSAVIGQPFYRTDTDQFLIYDGSNWDVMGPGGISIVSVTSPSAASPTADITIEENKLYLVKFEFVKNTAGNLELRFNSDASGNNYHWANHNITLDNPVVESNSGSNADNEIKVCGGIGTGEAISGHFTIDTTNKNSTDCFVNGNVLWNDATDYVNTRFTGIYNQNTTLTDFEFVCSAGTITGEIYLYEYALST